MSTEIYYFSGTGNSLHVAKELQKRIPETDLIPIVSLLNQDVIATNGETVGFVFPIHLMSVPVPVKKFLEKLAINRIYLCSIDTMGHPNTGRYSHRKNIEEKRQKLGFLFHSQNVRQFTRLHNASRYIGNARRLATIKGRDIKKGI